MKKNDFIEAIPLISLILVAVYSIIEVLTTDAIFGTPQYIGLSLLGISSILFFVQRRIYRYVFGSTLLLGLPSLIGFSTSIMGVYFLGIPIQILLLPLILLFTWINKDSIKPMIQQLLGNSTEQKQSRRHAKVNGFKRRFEKLTDQEIESKLKEQLVPEALEALNQLKNERKN